MTQPNIKNPQDDTDAFLEMDSLGNEPTKSKSNLLWVGGFLIGLLVIIGLTTLDRTSFDRQTSQLSATVKLPAPTEQTETSSEVDQPVNKEESNVTPKKESNVTDSNNPCDQKSVEFLNIKWCQTQPNNLQVTSKDGSGFLVLVQGDNGGAQQFPKKEATFTVNVPIYQNDNFKLSGKTFAVSLSCEKIEEGKIGKCTIKWPE